jgi:hypothetical protein
MTYDPSLRPPHWAQLLNDAEIAYEDSEYPRIAIKPSEWDNLELAMMWVRTHKEFMMFRNGRSFALVYVAADGSTPIENAAFYNCNDEHTAATKMRKWLHDQGLIAEVAE